jgi:hypothetical protein
MNASILRRAGQALSWDVPGMWLQHVLEAGTSSGSLKLSLKLSRIVGVGHRSESARPLKVARHERILSGMYIAAVTLVAHVRDASDRAAGAITRPREPSPRQLQVSGKCSCRRGSGTACLRAAAAAVAGAFRRASSSSK